MENNEPRRIYVFLIYVSLAVLTLAGFGYVLECDFVDLDDVGYVSENTDVQAGISKRSIIWAFTQPLGGNWHPLTTLSHMLDCELFGVNPYAHHAVNLLFHLVSSLLLLWILRKMTLSLWPSVFVAAVFALHPLRVESVAWISERKDVLSALFWMLTMTAYFSYTQKRSLGRYLLVVVAMALGLMSKPMLVTLPFVLLLLDYWPLNRNSEGISWRQLAIEKIPLFAMVAVSCVVTFLVQQSTGAMRMGTSVPLGMRLANAVVSYLSYIAKMVYPVNLAAMYPYPGAIALWKVALAVITLVGISAGVIYMAIVKKQRMFLVGWTWYLGTLIPVIGIVQVGVQAIADRYTYIPTIGLSIMVGWAVSNIAQRYRSKNAILTVLTAVVAVLMFSGTQSQVRYWKDSISLSARALEVTKDNYMMERIYASALVDAGRQDQAISHYKRAIQLNDRYANGFNNLGLIYMDKDQTDLALDYFAEALRRDHPHPEQVYSNIATTYAQIENFDLAMEYFDKALAIKADYFEAFNNKAVALQNQGMLAEAVSAWKRSLDINPDQVKVLARASWVIATSNKIKHRDSDEAIRLASRACELTDYNEPGILDALAAAYASAGQFDKAVNIATRAIELAIPPDHNELAENIRQRLELYRAEKPYRLTAEND